MIAEEKFNKSDVATVENFPNSAKRKKDKPQTGKNCFQLAYPVKTNQPCIQKIYV